MSLQERFGLALSTNGFSRAKVAKLSTISGLSAAAGSSSEMKRRSRLAPPIPVSTITKTDASSHFCPPKASG